MGYIGNFPTALPLSTNDLNDGIVTTAKLANDSVNASKFDETDDYTFTGTVTGAGGGIFESQLLHVRDEKSQNVAGGGITSGSFVTRDLNTIKTNEITGASLSSNQITLPAGTYYVDASAPATEVASHRAKLRNNTAGADIILGTTEHNRSDNNYAHSRSRVCGRFTLSVQSVVILQHRCNATRNTDGLGVPSNIDTEVYSEVKIWKVA